MRKKDEKKLLIGYIVLLFASAGITFFYSYVYLNDVFFTTRFGLELTKAQYDNLRKVYTNDLINILPEDHINDIKDNTHLVLEDSSEIIVETRTYYDENNQPIKSVHREITEAEARGIPCLPEKRLLYGWSK